jgi:hypothetical protein
VGGGASVGLLQAAINSINKKAIIGTVFFITTLLLYKDILCLFQGSAAKDSDQWILILFRFEHGNFLIRRLLPLH